MDSDPWEARLSTPSRRYRSRLEMYSDEADGEEESKVEYVCPFCGEEFDMVGLYCHMDEEHPVAIKSGVCPVCSKRVGQEFVAHITSQHGNILKIQNRRRVRKGIFSSTLNALRRELREGSLANGSWRTPSSASTESDTLLSSFVFSPSIDTPVSAQPHSSSEAAGEANGLDENHQDKIKVTQKKWPIPSKDREEAAQKCEFIRGLLSSTILNDDDEDL